MVSPYFIYFSVFIDSKKKRKSETSERRSSNITSFLGKPGTSKSPNLSRKDDGFLTYEELIYWQENFKLPNCEAGTTPQNSNRRRSRKSLTDPPIKELSLNEWMAWQNVPSQVYKITHSRRTEHLIEILEFIELHGENADAGDDGYDVEMMTFLNEEDLLRPEDDAMILGDADDNGGDNEKVVNSKNKTEKSKKKKKSVENDSNKNKNNDAKQSKITRKPKKSKSISPQQKTKWREYLKGFENDDQDFDTGEIEAKNLEEKQNNDEIPLEILDGEKEESAEGTKKVSLENNAMEMEEEDDAFEVSSQNFSQLLPSLTPLKDNVLRTRITDVTDNHAIPLPPSLDSLDEISPFTFDKNSTSCDKENMQKSCQDKIISCRRKVSQFKEPEVVGIGCLFGEKTKNFTCRTLGKSDIEEPPDLDLDLDFENEMDEKWKNENNGSNESTKNFSTSRKKDLIEVPLELDLENEFGEFDNEEENLIFEKDKSFKMGKNLRVKSQSRSTDFSPEQTDPLFAEGEDDFQEKASSQSSKPRKNSGFGAGVVCKNKTSDVFDDDIEIEFGDDSLADGLLADLDEEEFERNSLNNHSKTGNNQGLSRKTVKKSKDERKNLHIDNQDDENQVHGENDFSRSETAPKKSKLKLSSKEKSSCDNSLKNSILKLGAFERNTVNSTKKSFNFVTDSTHEDMERKKFENKSEAHSNLGKTDDNSGENPQRIEDFNFKKPDAILGNRTIKFNRSAISPKSCTNRENTETTSPVLTSSPLRKSLKLNSKSNPMKKQDNINRKWPSCDEFEEEKSSKISEMQKDQKQNCSPFKDLRSSPFRTEKYSRSFDITHNEIQVKEKDDTHKSDSGDSPILQKPLRERLASRGLEDNVNNINSTKCNQKELGIILNGEDSPVVRKKSKSRTLQNIAAISPLQGSQNSLRELDVHDGESPVVRRRSKAKIRDGNVFAIAESDEEFEDDIQETDLQALEDEVCNEVKAHNRLENQRDRNSNKIRGISNRNLVGASDSEEEFLVGNRKGRFLTAHAQRNAAFLQPKKSTGFPLRESCARKILKAYYCMLMYHVSKFYMY